MNFLAGTRSQPSLALILVPLVTTVLATIIASSLYSHSKYSHLISTNSKMITNADGSLEQTDTLAHVKVKPNNLEQAKDQLV